MTFRAGHCAVVLYSGAADEPASHETVTRAALAAQIAALGDADYLGEYDPGRRYSGRLYFVPAQTLLASEAQTLGIQSERDLFGGVVPHPFVATKTITHPLVDPHAFAPVGWSHAFGAAISKVVLQGFSVFTAADARVAAQRLLPQGKVRIKPARGIGGNGQSAIGTIAELDAVLAAMDPVELTDHGVVVEENLADVITYSVGQVRIADICLSYHGTQRLTPNHRGAEVYGGSELTVIQGQFDALLELDLTPETSVAIAQARCYDDATRAFPGFIASRRNYDIAQGRDGTGRLRIGVLEQSWRIGGASAAEIAALAAFAADPQLHAVRASSWEFFGDATPPPHASIHYRGIDHRVGPLTKYSVLDPL